MQTFYVFLIIVSTRISLWKDFSVVVVVILVGIDLLVVIIVGLQSIQIMRVWFLAIWLFRFLSYLLVYYPHEFHYLRSKHTSKAKVLNHQYRLLKLFALLFLYINCIYNNIMCYLFSTEPNICLRHIKSVIAGALIMSMPFNQGVIHCQKY